MSKLLIVLALLIVVVAGCTNALPAVAWCYRFDFRNNNYGFHVTYGNWIPGGGFSTDDQGRFALTYTHSGSVSPAAAILTAARGTSTLVPTKVIVKADVFGLSVRTIQSVVPADVTTADLIMTGSGSSDKLEITGKADDPIQLLSLQVRGNGGNPFGSSNCSTAATTNPNQPINVPIPGDVGDTLSEADAALAGVDVPLTAPNGSPLLPSLASASMVFGYTKWIVSGAAAEEIGGPFSGLISHMGIYVVMNFVMTGIYFVIYGAIYIVRWAIWLYRTVLQIIQVIATLIASVPGVVILAVLVGIAAAIALIVAIAQGASGA